MNLSTYPFDVAYQQPVVNVASPSCAACQSLVQIYSSNHEHDSAYLNEGTLQGEYTRTSSGGLELSVIDVTFLSDMTLASGKGKRDFRLGITCCLDGGMTWKTGGGDTFSIKKGELLVTTCPSAGVCTMSKGQYVRCVDLAVTKDVLLPAKGQDHIDDSMFFKKITMSPRIRAVVADILDGRPAQSFRSMYSRGKAQELLAVVLDKVSTLDSPVKAASLPNDWADALLRAKKVIDDDLANAPSLTQLSREVCLNEYKLKTGFKKLFGLPVHAYIIDQRLEVAHDLLQRGGITVTQAAHQVGYTELGRFAGTFRKKYGITPSKVLKAAVTL